MKITSTAFTADTNIPDRFTCESSDISPPLRFEDVPDDAEELALVVDDPDAPSGTFTHWLVWGLDPDDGEIVEGASGDLDAHEGTNDFDQVGWRGPCPPEGDGPHSYRFTLYALGQPVDLEPGADRAAVDTAVKGNVLRAAELCATFER